MRFSQYAGTSIIPLLARVVLCAAFLPAGLHKVWNTKVYEGDAARILSELSIGEPLGVAMSGQAVIVPASFQETPTGDLKPVNQDPGEDAEGPADDTREPLVPPPADELEPSGAEPAPTAVEAKAVYDVAVILVQNGWEWQPATMAWMAGLTELLGGSLILIGLFSRLWGLGLAITMGSAFYMTSMTVFKDPGVFALATGVAPGGVADGYQAFNRTFCQAGLMVLALGVFLTGPGFLSVDRFLFGRRGGDADLDELEPMT